MISNAPRSCPLCGGEPDGRRFPYQTRYDGIDFNYLGCRSCATVFVDPVPGPSTFARMYAKSAYHDVHYGDSDVGHYRASVDLMAKHLPAGAFVLDYGCGAGGFMSACKEGGYRTFGVDFDASAARSAGDRVGCDWASVSDFASGYSDILFDVIHLGDVLEHLPDPLGTLLSLVPRLRPGGYLYVEGPLEVNPSPVYWSAQLFGSLKRLVKPGFIASHPPTHLFRTDAKAQREFFSRLGSDFRLVEWDVYETGWPYKGNGPVKTLIGDLACRLGGLKIGPLRFGNRFRGMLLHQGVAAVSNP